MVLVAVPDMLEADGRRLLGQGVQPEWVGEPKRLGRLDEFLLLGPYDRVIGGHTSGDRRMLLPRQDQRRARAEDASQ